MSSKNKALRKKSSPKTSSAPSLGKSSSYSDCAPAGLFRRIAAAVYDFLILAAIWLLVGLLFMATALGGKAPANAAILQIWLFPLLVLATLGFYSWFWTHGGQTLGMRAWKLKVVHARLDGSPITLTQCLLRCLTGIFSWGAFGLGYLWVYVDPSRDTWHDIMSGTRTLIIPKDMM